MYGMFMLLLKHIEFEADYLTIIEVHKTIGNSNYSSFRLILS